MSETLFIRVKGRIQGPFTPDQLQALSKRGQFGRLHEVSTDGMTWARATTRPDLFPGPAVNDFVALEVAPETAAAMEVSPPPSTRQPAPDAWYYHQLGTKYGPVEFDHLHYLARTGQVAQSDLVWKEGLSEWIAAGRVPGLFTSALGAMPVVVGLNAVSTMDLPRTSGFAVASLVLGLVGWLCGIGSILAIVFGAVALNQIREGRGRVTGKGMAISGLTLGIVALALTIGWFIFVWMVAISSVPISAV